MEKKKTFNRVKKPKQCTYLEYIQRFDHICCNGHNMSMFWPIIQRPLLHYNIAVMIQTTPMLEPGLKSASVAVPAFYNELKLGSWGTKLEKLGLP